MGGRIAGTVRIISGQWRSRRIEVPPGDRTRPMIDRVKAAVFDTLGSYYETPGRLPPIVVADVFAGGGTLGLEAISRGAGGAVFVESDGCALGVLRRNLAKLHVGAGGAVEPVNAWSGLSEILLQYRCALVFLDPPYRDAQDGSAEGKVVRLLDELTPFARATESPVLVLHHPQGVSFDLAGLVPWRVHAVRRYGSTGITFIESQRPPGPADQGVEDSP